MEELSELEARLTRTNGSHKPNGYHGCPYFGLPNDPKTRLLLPGQGGFCHKASPPEHIKVEHQHKHCLSANHLNCPVFARERVAPLPKDIKQPSQQSRFSVMSILQVAIQMIVLVAGAGLLFLLLTNDGTQPPEPNVTNATASDGGASVAVITDTVTATETMLPPTPTTTNTPSPTATMVPPTPTKIPPTWTSVPTETPSPTSTPVPITKTATLNEPVVNARIGPDESFPAVQLLRQEDNVTYTITGQSDDGDWWQLCCVTEEPIWVSAVTVDVTGEETAVPIIRAPSPSIIVNVETLNARTEPDTEAGIVGELTNGEQFTVTGQIDSWWQICCLEGESAWVFAETVTFQGRLKDVSTTAVP